MYKRPRHERIAVLLRALDADLLRRCACLFGGGTALVMRLGEYRDSDDVDFLCADASGYGALRDAVSASGLQALLANDAGGRITVARPVRPDRYGLRGAFAVDGQPVKIEIISLCYIGLHPDAATQVEGLATLGTQDAFATKILANADRWADGDTHMRDFVDMLVLMRHDGPLPTAALDAVCAAYGNSARTALAKAARRFLEEGRAQACLRGLGMDPALLVPLSETAAYVRALCADAPPPRSPRPRT